ncbi:MAG: GatB/YqeY domain-containing protein [Gemmatimonadaceae bacterium]|nr:GatB/YqeY domain-containing protein [Gemmatimonadaceae bacterium]
MSELLARLQSDLNAARKAQDKPGTLLLGTLLADVKNRSIELRRDLTDEEVREVLRRGIKRRRESIEMYERAGREELAARERDEVARLETYLPANVSDDEVRAAAAAAIAAGATTIGAVMGKLMPQFKGRAEGATINRIAREELQKQGV